MEKYIIKATSPNSMREGFIGEDNFLYYNIENACLFNREYKAFTIAEECKCHWLNVHIEKVNIEIH